MLPAASYKPSLRSRAPRLDERKLEMEQRLEIDELNARTLQLDNAASFGIDIAALAEEVRELRHEVQELKQQNTLRGQ